MLIPACRKLTLNTLGVTAFLMLLFNPVWLFDVGFQLSFSAVAAIVLLQPGLYGLLSVKNRLLRKAWGLVTVSVAAQIGTAPLVMLYFSRFSTHFLLTNLLVIPLVSLIVYAAVILLVLTPFPVLQQLFADVVEIPLRMQNALLRWIEQLPLASIDRIWVDIWDVFLFYCVTPSNWIFDFWL
jgi:competence protein ComEC